ncbi:universal stress protein [Botryobacter ruber]|uniref:universal stress protein n=1 Tax=Botryobacter ruber TaxID=2171629 RepID=UPI000E0B1AD6|nr:universal stress protein [Botryobacter ruber]
MKKILAPIDFSDCAANAMHYAAALANQTRSTLVLVHIIPTQVVAPTMVPVVLTEPNSETKAHYTGMLDDMAQHILSVNEFRFKVDTICLDGVFLDKMLKLIRTEQPDLVVMGTRGANSALDNLIGTNTSSLIMESTCPVLAVPEKAHFHNVYKIAFASNLKDNEDTFLRQLFQFAQPLNSEVSIINVKTEKHPRSDSDDKVIEYITGHFPANKYSIAQIKGEDVIDGINTFLQENKIDILAIAMHEHGFFEGLFHESVSRELILHSSVPLLALHERDDRRSNSREMEMGAKAT